MQTMQGTLTAIILVLLAAGTVLVLCKRLRNPFKTILKQARAGDPDAQYRLGVLYYRGKYAPQDYTQAFHWFETAAANGCARAYTALAGLYNAGTGCEKNAEKTFSLYQTAAGLGDFEARINLAVCYLEGIGTEVNETRGFETMKAAADDQSPLAQLLTGDLYERGCGTEKNDTLALKYYILANKQGEPRSKDRIKRLKTKK